MVGCGRPCPFQQPREVSWLVPTSDPLCLVLQAQLSQALEELGGQKQRADTVSPDTPR
jgi:hypothetical protein